MSLNRSMSRSMRPTREPVSSASRIVRRIRSASMRRLGRPVSESSSASRAFSRAVACSRRDAVHTVRNSTIHSASRPSATTSATVRTASASAALAAVWSSITSAAPITSSSRACRVALRGVARLHRHVDVEDAPLGAALAARRSAPRTSVITRALGSPPAGHQVEPVAVGEPGRGLVGRAVDERAVERPEPQLDQPLAEPGRRGLDGVPLLRGRGRPAARRSRSARWPSAYVVTVSAVAMPSRTDCWLITLHVTQTSAQPEHGHGRRC